MVFASGVGEFNMEVFVDDRLADFKTSSIEGANLRSPNAFWLNVRTGSGKVLKIVNRSGGYWDGQEPEEFVFHIDPNWSRGPAELLGMHRVRASGGVTCPPPDNLYRVSIASSAVAYRAQWAGPTPGMSIVPTHHLLRRGEQPYEVVMPEPGAKVTLPDLPHVVDLGLEPCVGHSIPAELLDSGIAVELTALYPDGGEQRLGSIYLNALPGTVSTLDKLWLLPGPKETAPLPPRKESDPGITSARLLAFFATLAMLGLLGMLVRRRPRLAIAVGLGLAGSGIILGAAGLSVTTFLPGLGALVTWLVLRWARVSRQLKAGETRSAQSCGLPTIVAQQPTEAFAALDLPCPVLIRRRNDKLSI